MNNYNREEIRSMLAAWRSFRIDKVISISETMDLAKASISEDNPKSNSDYLTPNED